MRQHHPSNIDSSSANWEGILSSFGIIVGLFLSQLGCEGGNSFQIDFYCEKLVMPFTSHPSSSLLMRVEITAMPLEEGK